MAISENRLSTTNLTDMLNTNLASIATYDYSSITSKALNSVKEPLSSLVDNSPMPTSGPLLSALDKLKPQPTNIGSSALSIFEDTLCKGLSLPSLGLPKFNLSLFRDLDFEMSLCGKSIKLNPIDAILNITKPLGNKKDLLSKSNEKILNKFIDTDTKQLLKSAGLNSSMSDCYLNRTKNGLVNGSNGYGNTLTSKLNMNNLLNSRDCNPLVGLNSYKDKFISDMSATNIIDSLSVDDSGIAVPYVSNMLADNNSRSSTLTGISRSLSYANDDTVDNKLLLASSASSSASNPQNRNIESIQLRTDSNLILNNLSNTSTTTNSPTSDAVNLTNGLDVVDPNWSRDSEGNTNLYRTAGNERLASVSNSYITSRQPINNTTGSVTTNLSRYDQIAIVNAVV